MCAVEPALSRRLARLQYGGMHDLDYDLRTAQQAHIEPHEFMPVLAPLLFRNRAHFERFAGMHRGVEPDPAGRVYPCRQGETIAQDQIGLAQNESGMQQWRRTLAVYRQLVAHILAPVQIVR